MTTPETPVSHSHEAPHHEWRMPHFDWLTYFYGQVLTPQHLQRAQQSMLERFKLHNHCLHGWGVACGLRVKAEPPSKDECPPEAHDEASPRVPMELCEKPGGTRKRIDLWIEPGLALDSHGNELLVRRTLPVDVDALMSREDREELKRKGAANLYVSLRYHRFGIEAARPQLAEACGASADPVFGFWRDGVCVEVTLERPPQDERCETCCGHAPVHSVLLTEIIRYDPDKPIQPEQIRNRVRRPLAVRVPTVITSVSWHHGASYAPEAVDNLLWNHGLRVRFSRPVHTSTLQPGVFDVYLIEMGKGRSGLPRVLKGEFILPKKPMVEELTYRLLDSERVDPGDRIFFVLRSDFILDACCEPVDGTHVGGRIPAEPPDDNYPKPAHIPPVPVCEKPPRRFGPWTSGDRAGGGTFESWIFVREGQERPRKQEADQ